MITASGADDGTATTTAVLPKLPVSVDTKGRVRVTKEQRRALLGEFARSREPAPQFARRMGLKYSTFAAWVQRYGHPKLPARPAPLRLLEAVVTSAAARSALWVHLPGGARVELGEASQVSLVALGARTGNTMLSFSGSLKVFVALEPCDMRNGFNGLHALVTERLGEDPRGGALFVFTNRRHTRLKILCWDGTGLWLLTKRLEEGTFSWPKNLDPQTTKLSLTPQALALLTDGVDLRGAKLRPWYEREG